MCAEAWKSEEAAKDARGAGGESESDRAVGAVARGPRARSVSRGSAEPGSQRESAVEPRAGHGVGRALGGCAAKSQTGGPSVAGMAGASRGGLGGAGRMT